jgi:integrase
MGRRRCVRPASATSVLVDFRYRGVRCQERIKLDPTAATTAKYVEGLKARINFEIAAGTFDYARYFPRSKRARRFAARPGMVLTWGELFKEWLESIEKTVTPETYGDYAEFIANTWRPRLAGLKVSDPILPVVNQWLAGKVASKKRLLNVLTPLRQAARYAAGTAKLLQEDPLAGLEVRRPDELSSEDVIDPFTPAEIDAIVAHLEPENANLVTWWAWSGPREGEAFALTWADVDLAQEKARISKSRRGGRLKVTKTASGNRIIKLLPPAVEALQRQRAYTLLKHREVFLRPGTDEPWGADKPFRLVWTAALAAAGVRYRFPRQLRHTFASWMLGGGENPLWVSQQLGHKNPAITLAVYARFIPGMWPDAGMRAYRGIMSSAS